MSVALGVLGAAALNWEVVGAIAELLGAADAVVAGFTFTKTSGCSSAKC